MGRLSSSKPRLGAAAPRLAAGEESLAPRRSRLAPLYRTARWRALRLAVLERDRWTCRQTGVLLVGRYPAADSPVVDHVVPHRGDERLFWDPANLQAVSKAWHDAEKQRRERAAAGGGGV
jgi:5-methylcytosine-specific restriction endonuclease McrA